MIQIRRGKTKNLRNYIKPLAEGQPGYDKDKHKIKIGNGEDLWKKLPYASGLFDYEILNSEAEAKTRYALDDEDITIISYGTDSPDENTIGQIYLQYYDAEPETDYIVDNGVSGIWKYHKYKSGFARCFGTLTLETAVKYNIGSFYKNNSNMTSIEYPFEFIDVPSEVVTVQSPGGLVWIAAANGINNERSTAVYNIISADTQNNAVYKISFIVEGYWR